MQRKITFLMILFLSLGTWTIQAQSPRKMAGIWERVAKKGNDPCAIDKRIELQLNGSALIHYGQRFEECKITTTEYSNWLVEKKEIEQSGKTKKFQILTLQSDRDTVHFIIEALKGDVMKVRVEVVDYDTTVMKTMIFRKK